MNQPTKELGAREARFYEQGFWRSEDLWGTLSRTASRKPDALALITDDKQITYRDMITQAEQFGLGLKARGVRAGDVVLLQARNSIETNITMLACMYVGAIVAPIPPMFSELQLNRISAYARPKVYVGLADEKEVARTVASGRTVPTVELIVVPDALAGDADTVAWSTLLSREDGGRRQPVDADAPAMLLYSSGTTGVPKGVTHSSNTVRFPGEQLAKMHKLGLNDKFLVTLQFGFVGGTVYSLLAGALVGSTMVLMRSWDPELCLQLIEKHRINYTILMPTHGLDVLASPALAKTDTSSLTRVNMSGLDRDHRIQAREQFTPEPMPDYGLTECIGNSTCWMGDDVEKILATEGHPFEGTEIRIVGEGDRLLPVGETGAVLIDGPSRLLGYYAVEEMMKEVLTEDGFFRTGDLGRLDEEGYFTYIGREKDIIRRGGITIIPADIEAAMRLHPRIKDVSLIGVPDPRLGERACACIISKDGKAIELEDLTAFLGAQGVAKYQWPERVEIMDEFPRTPSLKPKKPELLQQVLAKDEAARANQS